MSYKLITVIVPCYNQGIFLCESLGSILKQTYKEWECIIVNDGSTDNTEAIALEFCKKDSRFKYVKKENGGLSSARNFGLDLARGSFIQFLDADDLIANSKFLTAIEYFNSSKECDLIITDFEFFNNSTPFRTRPKFNLAEIGFNYKSILLEWDITFNIPIHCGMFRSSIFKSFRFNTSLGAKEDWLMWLYVSKRNPNYRFIDERQAFYRTHTDSMTRNKPFMYENAMKAFTYVFFNEVQEEYRQDFFEKVNKYWMSEIERYRNLCNNIYSSNSYKLGNNIIRPLSWLKR